MPDPVKVPDKFMKDGKVDVDALAASYIELEKKQGAGATPPATTPKGFEKFDAEYAKDGKLSDASYAELEKTHGFSKGEVDDYIAFRKSKVNAVQAAAHEAAGGEEGYKAMADWARGNLTPDEIAAYDKTVKSRDTAAIKLAVGGLRAKFEAAAGRDPTLIGGTNGSVTMIPFKNYDEAVAMRRDPKYAKDPEFRKQYTERLKKSKL